MLRLFTVTLAAGMAAAQVPQVLPGDQIGDLEERVRSAPQDKVAATLLGLNYAWAMLGVTEVDHALVPQAADRKLMSGRVALRARRALEECRNARVVGEAGMALRLHPWLRGGKQKDAALMAYGEELLQRAVRFAPEDSEWRTQAIALLWLQAGHSKRPVDAGAALRQVREHLARTRECWRQEALGMAAKIALRAGEYQDVENWATELLLRGREQLCQYGSAAYDGNTLLGQVALRRDADVVKAKWFLREAGSAASSATLVSFGPNLGLAQDLLGRGEREAVLEFLEQCRRFWKLDYGCLDRWTNELRAGKSPDLRREIWR